MLDRALHAVAIVGLESFERVDVGDEGVARRGQATNLVFETTPLGLGDATRVRFGIAHQCLRLGLRLRDELTGLPLCLGDRLVGGLLRELQRTREYVGVGARDTALGHHGPCRRRRGSGRRGSGRRRRGRARLRLETIPFGSEVLDRRRGALEQLVDIVTVVTAPRLADIGFAEFLGGYVGPGHAEMLAMLLVRREFSSGIFSRSPDGGSTGRR